LGRPDRSMMKPKQPTQRKTETVDLSREEIEEALAQAKAALPEKTFRILEKVVQAYLWVLGLLEKKRATIGRLRRMLFGPKTEKMPPGKEGKPSSSAKRKQDSISRRGHGHGRNGAAEYTGARKVCVPHETLKPGDRCPGCGKGKVYEQAEPGVLVRVTGRPPLEATVYELQKLRCNLCGEIFTAHAPELKGVGGGQEKYDATCAAMIALLKYGSGFPFHRLGRLQGSLGIPLAPATQWKIVSGAARAIERVHEELIRQAAQGKVVHNDDTTMRILMWMGRRREESQRRQEEAAAAAADGGLPSVGKRERTGIFTSGILSVTAAGPRERRVALFFTGRKHAGENLAQVLARRASGLSPPIQMCDALSRNVPSSDSGDLATILANCLAHGRRQFVDVAEAFPKECGRILKGLQTALLGDTQNFDLSRLFRLPGTYNVKDPKHQKRCRVVRVRDVRYPPSLFQKFKLLQPKRSERSLLPGGVAPHTHRVLALVRASWTEGRRHRLALGLAGFLRKAGWAESQVRAEIEAICAQMGDKDLDDRRNCVRDTFKCPLQTVSGITLINSWV
jgi:transposase